MAGDVAAERRTRWLLGAMGLVGALFFGIGANAWRLQHDRLATYRPVSAVVVDAGVETVSSDDGGPTYRPALRYRYEIAGRSFVADGYSPLRESRSGAWAREVVARYPVGRAVTAYVDPADPTRGFLDRRGSPLPWLFMGFAAVFLAIVGAAAALGERR